MNIEKALQMFNIEDIASETEESIKKKYKKLMIKYHPDNCNGDNSKAIDVGLALEIIKETLEEIKTYNLLNTKPEVLNILLTIDRLIDIYKGEVITMHRKDANGITQEFEVNNKVIQKNNTLIIVSAEIVHNGTTKVETSVKQWSINDNYEINTDIYVKEIDKQESIKIKVGNFEKEFKITGMYVSIPIILDYNIKVNVNLRKVLKVEE